jgi:hypothetical protein
LDQTGAVAGTINASRCRFATNALMVPATGPV